MVSSRLARITTIGLQKRERGPLGISNSGHAVGTEEEEEEEEEEEIFACCSAMLN